MSERYELHEFDVDERYGRIGESIVVQALGSLADWRVEPRASDIPEQKRFGIDRVAWFRGNRVTIEIKTDMRGYRTFRIALETHDDRDDGSRRDGWMRTTTAGYIISLLAEKRGIEAFGEGCDMDRSAMMYVMATQRLQERMPEWRRWYAPKKARNVGYFTSVIPVPVETMRAAGVFVAEYGVAYRHLNGNPQVTAIPRPTDGRPFSITHKS